MQEYDLEKDHAEIKKQIKHWEKRIDAILANPNVLLDSRVGEELEQMSQEMMEINI